MPASKAHHGGAEARRLTEQQKRIERMFQRAMDLRDSTGGASSEASRVVEDKYTKEYFHAYRITHDVIRFRHETRFYRAYLRALKT